MILHKLYRNIYYKNCLLEWRAMMAEVGNIIINNFIVHILDNTIQMPVLSNSEQDLNNEIADFIGGHLVRVLKDDTLKYGEFDEESQVKSMLGAIKENESNFIAATSDIASMMYNIMYENPTIPSGDVAFVRFELDGIMHIAILKFNYKTSYIHYVDSDENGTVNSIIKQKTALPSEGQRIEEAIIVNLEDFSTRIMEKRYEINGQNDFYISTILLNCNCSISETEKVKQFKKATDNFSKKYCSDDIEAVAELRAAINQSIKDKESIDIENIAETAFKDNMDMKNTYVEHIENAGISERNLDVDEEIVQKIFKKHKIKTDVGIEISVPFDFFKEKDKIEFINNIDGTVSIVIKNVKTI